MNNKLCDIIGTVGCLIAFIALGGIFLGASWWLGAVAGIALILLSQFEYED